MKGMIFAAGIGSRLKPWTDFHPKALVEVGNQPMLGRVINKMTAAGIKDIVVNVHHFADQIRQYLSAGDFDAHISVSDETDLLLETGGGIRKALDLIGSDTVVVHNADILSDFSLADMIDAHARSGADITLLTAERETSRYLIFDDSGVMQGWTDVRTGQVRGRAEGGRLLAFDGVHIISPAAYPMLRQFRNDGEPFSIIDFYVESCSRLKIQSFALPAGCVWLDIGRPETLEKAQLLFKYQ